jgi:ribosomal protein S18 acetylase RimI-like enzyme
MILRIVDLASEGVVPMMWAEFAPEGMQAADVGQSLIAAEEGPFSYRFGHLAESDGSVVAGLIGYPLPEEPVPPDPDTPPAFLPVEDMVNLAPGRWYINFVATLSEHCGCGHATALMEHAEALARQRGCRGLALIVAATNDAAVGLYDKLGFSETARCPFDVSEFGLTPTDAILMIRDF